jgi:hypothetical protein
MYEFNGGRQNTQDTRRRATRSSNDAVTKQYSFALTAEADILASSYLIRGNNFKISRM